VVATSTTAPAATASPVAVAAKAGRLSRTRSWIGRSTSTYEKEAMATVRRQRTVNRGSPPSPVRSALAAMNTGQCHR
jgi:hypothetical protein